MAYMRGAYYIWGDGTHINICVGRDINEGDAQASVEAYVKAREEMGEEPDPRIVSMLNHVTPEDERTGLREPQSVALPYEVCDSFVVMRFFRMLEEGTLEETMRRTAEKYEGNFGADALVKLLGGQTVMEWVEATFPKEC